MISFFLETFVDIFGTSCLRLFSHVNSNMHSYSDKTKTCCKHILDFIMVGNIYQDKVKNEQAIEISKTWSTNEGFARLNRNVIIRTEFFLKTLSLEGHIETH